MNNHPKLKKHFRICRRCLKFYYSKTRLSKYCPSCNHSKNPHKESYVLEPQEEIKQP